MKDIYDSIAWIKKEGLFPDVPEICSPHAPEVMIGDKKVLLFATNNYLGMMHDPRVVEAAEIGLKKWGIGNGSARLLTGNLKIHNELENAIAKFKGKEAAISFVTGYMANSGTIPALVDVIKPDFFNFIKSKIFKTPDTVIFSDEYNHASIIAGVKMSGAKKEIYKHVDMVDLEKRLSSYSKSKRKIIITDGVFSMDGDIAPLPKIVELAKKYNAMTYVDDAHGTGILGPNGRGIEDHFGMEGSVDVLMGTFTKAFGGVGGFVVGDKELIDYLKVRAQTFIFTAPIAPPVACGLIKAIEIVKNEPWRREKISSNAKYLREKLLKIGIDICGSQTQIIPILIGDEKKCMEAGRILLEEKGIFIPPARWPAVPLGKARLRVTVTAENSIEQIDYLIKSIKEIKEKLNF
jgi:8-amino-7-oxononanoate synthase